MRKSFNLTLGSVVLIFSSCSQGEFTGDTGANRGTIKPPVSTTPNTNTTPNTTPGVTPDSGDLKTDDGGLIKDLNADYKSCLQLAKSGKRGYGQCGSNEVVVIVNDGGAKEMTCCPLASQSILSIKENEKHIARPGICQADEVLTGMQQNYGSYCTKINTSLVKLSAPINSTFVTRSFGGLLGQIAESYNIKDTCVCTEGYVAIGGHTTQDNRCTEQCVKIEKK
ncbi:MAG: hypothetical protein WCL28_01730 [bacterium]